VQGFSRPCERDRGYELECEPGFEQSICQWSMIVPCGFEADDHGAAKADEKIDKTIVLTPGVEYDQTPSPLLTRHLDQNVIA
jgi:hypothetical protein